MFAKNGPKVERKCKISSWGAKFNAYNIKYRHLYNHVEINGKLLVSVKGSIQKTHKNYFISKFFDQKGLVPQIELVQNFFL